MMKLSDIIQSVLSSGKVCSHYEQSLRNTSNLKGVMDLLMDVNGLDWLSSNPVIGDLDLRDNILSLCPAFVNSRYTMEHKNVKGNGYTTMLYVGKHKYGEYSEGDYMKIEAKSTILCLLRVHGQVLIPKNSFVEIYADTDTTVMVHIEKDARCIVNVKGKGMVCFNNQPDMSRTIIQHQL